jgi:hypothetical protein
MNEAVTLPDPATLTSPERLAQVQEYRTRRMNGEKLSMEELRHVGLLLRTERAQAPARTKAKKAAAPAPSLSDF